MDVSTVHQSSGSVAEYIQLGIAVVIAVASAAAAWGGFKYSIRNYEAMLKELRETIFDLRREMQDLSSNFQKEINLRVLDTDCRSERSECHQNRTSLSCEMSKQINLLVQAIQIQDEKRQENKDKNQEMFLRILEKMSVLEGVIRERERRFRQPLPEDLVI